jgi:hypothetical protein
MKKIGMLIFCVNLLFIKTAYSGECFYVHTYKYGVPSSSCYNYCVDDESKTQCQYWGPPLRECTYDQQYCSQWNTFAYKDGGFWDTQQWVSGDFNGDGKTDLAKSFNDGGYASIDVHLSNGPKGTLYRWATRQGGFWNSQKWVSGDFNGDGKTDMAKVYNDNGYATIDVHLSNGNGFSIQRWATRQGGFWDSQKWVTGDFNGDRKTDLAYVFNDGGYATIAVNLSTGNG